MKIPSVLANTNQIKFLEKTPESKIKKQNYATNVFEVASKTAASCMRSYALQPQFSFGKRIEEHRSWGANVKNSDASGQTVEFKLWAPKAEKVLVEVRNPKDKVSLSESEFKSEKLKDKWAGVWHVDSKTDDGKSVFVELKKGANGVFENDAVLPFKNGMYRYVLQDKNGNTISTTKDPVSKAQPHIFSWSQIYDNNDFQWTDKKWVEGKNSARVSDLARKPKEYLAKVGLSTTAEDGKSLQKPSNLIVKEMHIPTLTKEGSIEAVKKEIDRIAEEKIFNGILLMPVEGTYGENWGYDGVDKYAVSRGVASEKGKNDTIARNNALKELINYAHEKNINVGMDWVPSHIFKAGPTDEDAKIAGIRNGSKMSGNNLDKLAPYELPGQWGGNRFNMEDSNPNVRSLVRDYVVNMPMNWVDNYHVDFLRADQTPEMCSERAMKQVAQEVRYHFPHTVLHWEDHRTEKGLTRDLNESELPYNNLDAHLDTINKTENNQVSLENLGGNEHWDFAFSHAIEALLLNKEIMGYYPSIGTLANNMKDIGGTKYIMSHDEIGNDSGSRLITKIVHKDLNITNNLADRTNETPSQKHIRSLNVIEEFFKLYQFDRKNWDSGFGALASKRGLRHISRETMEAEFEKAKNKHKAAMGLLFMAPGSKMIFQGDSYGEINPFRFARNQAVSEPSLEKQKGYKFDSAVKKSKINPEENKINGIFKLTQAMSDLVRRNDSLQDVQPMENLEAMTPLIDEENKVMAVKRFNYAGNEVVALYNFGDKPLSNYKINNAFGVFGDSNWKETINSDAIEFEGKGRCLNDKRGSFRASENLHLNIPSNGVVVFEKTDKEGKLYNGKPLFS